MPEALQFVEWPGPAMARTVYERSSDLRSTGSAYTFGWLCAVHA